MKNSGINELAIEWMDKHPQLVGYVTQLTVASVAVGLIAFCIMRSQSGQQPIMSQRGLTVEKQFSRLSENDQALIVQDWQDEQEDQNSDSISYSSPYQ